MKETILGISGKPGLYRLVSQGRQTIIVEALDATRKRFPVGIRDRVTSLNEVSMYADSGDKPLMEIFDTIKQFCDGKPVPFNYKTASPAQLAEFMAKALPDYDRDRVYNTDIKKLIQWYNLLTENGLTEFVDPQGAEAETEAAETPAE